MTIILFRFLGLYFLGIGLSFFLNPKRMGNVYRLMIENEVALFLGGLMALIFGAVIISVHNIWVMNWSVFITIIGWMGLVKGVGLIAYPDYSRFFSFMFKRSEMFYRALSLIISIIGLFFIYKGFYEYN